MVACRPNVCMAWTSVSIASRDPEETTARPLEWTSIISLFAVIASKPK